MALGLLRNIYTGTRSLIGAVKDVNRASQIALIVGRHGFAQLLDAHRASREGKQALRAAVLAGETAVADPGVDLAGRLVRMIEELGPTFVKFGQILSSRPDLIPAHIAQRLEALQDHVAPIALETVREILIANLGKPPEEIFARFDAEPIASASIGQVHGARTPAGDEVVVKVQRPGLRAIFIADLSLLRFLVAQALELFPEAEALDLGTMIAEMESNLLRETDFSNEAAALGRFAANFAGNPHIHIPRAFAEFSTSQVLTMERIVGGKLTSIDDPELRQRTARIYLDAAYQMVFRDGLFHGDLHPGNVFLEADGRLGLIDFGMVGRLSRRRRDQLIDILFALSNNDTESIARQWYALCHAEGAVAYDSFESEVAELLEARVIGRAVQEIEMAAFFGELVSRSGRLGVRVPGEFMMLFKAMATTEGLARQIAAGINPIDMARPYVQTLIKERYSPARLRRVALSEGARLIDLARELPDSANRLLTRLERGELGLQLGDAGRDAQLERLVHAVQLLAAALIAVGGGLTGALTLARPGAGHLIALIAFVVSGLSTAWVLWGVLRAR